MTQISHIRAVLDTRERKKKETDTVLKDLTNWDREKSSAQRGKELAQLAKRLLYSFVNNIQKQSPASGRLGFH